MGLPGVFAGASRRSWKQYWKEMLPQPRIGASWAVSGASWAALSEALLDSLGVRFGALLGPLAPSWAALGLLGTAWAVFDSRKPENASMLKSLQQFVSHLESLLDVLLGLFGGRLGGALGPSSGLLGQS